MIKNLKTFCKVMEGLMWLYLPIILFSWTLSLIDLEAINPLKAAVGAAVHPLSVVIDKYFDFQFTFSGEEVDYTSVILAILTAFSAIIFMFLTKVLDVVAQSVEDAKLEVLKKADQKNKEKAKEVFLQELDKNKILYVLLKVNKIDKHENYLVKETDDSFSVGLVDSYETSIRNIAKSFSGKVYKEYNGGSDVSCFIFDDTEQFVIYLTYLMEKVKEINKGTAELNTVFTYTIASSCAYDAATAETDLKLTNKLLNLAGKEEIFITNTLKNKLENLKTDIKIKFESKGIYMLDNKQIDAFSIKIN